MQIKTKNTTEKNKPSLVSPPILKVTDQSTVKCHHLENCIYSGREARVSKWARFFFSFLSSFWGRAFEIAQCSTYYVHCFVHVTQILVSITTRRGATDWTQWITPELKVWKTNVWQRVHQTLADTQTNAGQSDFETATCNSRVTLSNNANVINSFSEAFPRNYCLMTFNRFRERDKLPSHWTETFILK